MSDVLTAHDCGHHYRVGETVTVQKVGHDCTVYLLCAGRKSSYINCYPNDHWHLTSSRLDFTVGHRYAVVATDGFIVSFAEYPNALCVPEGM